LQTQHGRGYLASEQVVLELEGLLNHYTAPEQQALLHYQAWRIAPSVGAHGAQAAALYRALYAEHAVADFRQRYHELTGELLPEPPLLERLPDWIPDTSFDLEGAITRTVALLAHLESTGSPS
jgi:hypothetical protein